MKGTVTIGLEEYKRLDANSNAAIEGLKDNVHLHVTQYSDDNRVYHFGSIDGENEATRIIADKVNEYKEGEKFYSNQYDEIIKELNIMKDFSILEFIKYKLKK